MRTASATSLCRQLSNLPSNDYIRGLQRAIFRTEGLDYGACGRFVQLCTDHLLIRLGKQLHSRLLLFSVTPDNFLASKLIAFYSKSGNTCDARKVFDRIPDATIFSWNALLISYTLHNQHADTLKLFSSLLRSDSTNVKPDEFTATCVLKALSSLFSDLLLAKENHCFVLRRGFDSDIFTLNALVTFYSRCDDLESARLVFDRIPERDIVSWNSMIAGYSQGGVYDRCKDLFRQMVSSGELKPNGLTVVSILQACAQSNDLIFGLEVHRYMKDNDIEMDIVLRNALVGLYAKCGSLDYARELFEEMPERDEVTYGSLISGYMLHGFVDKAMDLFRKLKKPALSTWNAVISGLVQNNHEEGVLDLVREMQTCGCRPNTVTLSSVLPIFSHFSNVTGGKEIHAYAIKNNYDRNIYVATAIVNSYGRSGCLREAKIVFVRIKGGGLIIWTAIISSYAAHGDANAALSLFDEMLNKGIHPDPVTFTCVLVACAHAGLVDEARKIFHSMFPKYGIEPLVEHYACIVGVLGRAGMLLEAVKFISEMPVEPSAKVLGALLHGASVSGDVEVGKFVCEKLFELEPENTGNYIIMANLYSQAGRWREADMVRERMNKVGLTKIPGSSWITIGGELQNFKSGDVSNGRRSEEIHETLQKLFELMREEGYSVETEVDEESMCG